MGNPCAWCACSKFQCFRNTIFGATVKLSMVKIQELARRTEKTEGLDSQLKRSVESFLAFSVAVDESTDITDVAQLAIFIRGVDETLIVTEEVLELVPTTDTTTAEDMFRSVVGALDRVWRTGPAP
ncbi:hypothetical protein MHYP_G00069630 [Metynnis hypsauchen]